MELALLVYAISLIEPIKFAAFLLVILPVLLSLMAGILVNNPAVLLKSVWLKIFVVPLFIFGVLTLIFMPNQKTAYLMVGAYTAQKVYENPTTERLSNKVIKSIEDKLDFYVEEAEKEALSRIKK